MSPGTLIEAAGKPAVVNGPANGVCLRADRIVTSGSVTGSSLSAPFAESGIVINEIPISSIPTQGDIHVGGPVASSKICGANVTVDGSLTSSQVTCNSLNVTGCIVNCDIVCNTVRAASIHGGKVLAATIDQDEEPSV